MKKVMYLFAAIAILAFAPQTAEAQCGDDEKSETKLVAAIFHADYCGACKKLKPEVMALQPKLEGKNVEWVDFDFTSVETKAAAKEKAEELGLSELYADNQATGFVLLVDAESKETVARLTSRQTSDEMYKIVMEKL
ncbi:thioredoxin domain-containing protein [Bacteroidota bacterium]